MSIDEAIARERQLAKEQRSHIGTFYSKIMGYDDEYIKKCEVCAEEHEQLAEWLEELKDYRDKNKMVVRIDIENMDSVKDNIDELSKYAESQYNNAIDDFVSACKENIMYKTFGLRECDIEGIAEQLKVGGENE